MSEVKVYYVVFTDKETGLVGAQNCVDYETAVERAILARGHERYCDVYITRVIDVEMPHSAL